LFTVALEDVKEICNGGSRDVSTLVLRQPLKMHGDLQNVFSVDLQHCEAGSMAIASILARKDEDSEDHDFEDSDDGGPDCEPDVSPQCNVTRGKTSSALAAFAAPEQYHGLLEVHVPHLTLGPLADELTAEEWAEGSFFMEYFKMLKASEVSVAPWTAEDTHGEQGSGLIKAREVTMTVPVPPGPLRPRETRLTTTYCLSVVKSEGGMSVTIQASTESHDVPFGDRFLVQERVELSVAEDSSGVKARKHGRCVFLKSCGLLQSRIQAASAADLTKSGQLLATLLQRRAKAERMETDRVPRTPAHAIFTVHVWELQRRTMIWSSVWHPPFMPHDGRKRWRWVDTTYQRHPWTTAMSHEESAASELPPVEPHHGWTPLSEWTVSPDTVVDCDAEGWQYAIDFYRVDRFWGNDLTGLHCRRRLWSRSFEDTCGQSSELSALGLEPNNVFLVPHTVPDPLQALVAILDPGSCDTCVWRK